MGVGSNPLDFTLYTWWVRTVLNFLFGLGEKQLFVLNSLGESLLAALFIPSLVVAC